MSGTESFEQAMDFANTVVAYCDIPLLDRLQAAHDREIRDTAQQEYDRGFHDGQHSMDAEHRAIAMRLRQLPLDGGSHKNLSQIARAVYHADFGWTHGACAALRDELVRLMGGVSKPSAADVAKELMDTIIEEGNRKLASDDRQVVEVSDDTCDSQCRGACAAGDGCDSGEQVEVSDDGADGDTLGHDARGHAVGCDFHKLGVSDGGTANDSPADFLGRSCGELVHLDGLVTYNVLDNERRKAIAELRKLPEKYKDDGKRSPAGRFNEALGDAIGVEGLPSFAKIRDRLIHLLGGDQPSGIDVLRAMDAESDDDGTCPNDDPTSSITDELRKFVAETWDGSMYVYNIPTELRAIADSIDEQFDRICAQQEAVLQETIDEMVVDQGSWKTTADMWKAKADKMERERDELSRKLEVIREYGVEVADAAGGGYEVYNKAAQERDELRDEDVKIKRQYAQLCVERSDLLDLLRDAAKEYMTTQAVCDELRYQREELMGKWIRERAERQELQARLNKANGENKGLRLSIDEQKESIAQRKKTIGKLTRDNTKVWKTVHELQAKLDEYDRTHVELPKDANGEVFRVGCTVRMVERHPEVLLTIHSMTLRDDGEWLLFAWDDKGEYSCNLSTLEFEVYEKPHDTAESIVRDLSMGSITESEAIERIGALNG